MTKEEICDRSHAVLKMEVMDLELWEARERAEEVILIVILMIW